MKFISVVIVIKNRLYSMHYKISPFIIFIICIKTMIHLVLKTENNEDNEIYLFKWEFMQNEICYWIGQISCIV